MGINKRIDGNRIKVDGLHTLFAHVFDKRTKAEVSMSQTFDITNLNKFIKEYNEKNNTELKLFHAICMACGKTIYHRPKLNIFVAGKHYYQRNKITLAFVAKQKFEDEAKEELIMLDVKPEMTIKEFSDIILGNVNKVRHNEKNDVGNTIDFYSKLPRFVLVIVFKVLAILDYFGIVIPSIIEGDSNYATVTLSNLGSIKANSCYHHLSDYGTCSIILTIGTAKTIWEKVDDDFIQKDVVDLTITLDERIADGFYFAKSLRIIDYMMTHPNSILDPIGKELPEELQSRLS